MRGLTKSYSGRKVVDDFDMDVPQGLDLRLSRAEWLGQDDDDPDDVRASDARVPATGSAWAIDILRESQKIKERVGYMTQRFSLYEDLTIGENLDFIARMYGMKNRRVRVKQALEDLGLADRANQLAGGLSGGWKQRLSLAACMLHDPDLLLLDEPTAGVDPKARRDFWDEIRRLAAQGVTVLVSTHYMDEAIQCDFIAYIAYGKKLISGPAREIPRMVGLTTWAVETGMAQVAGLEEELRAAPAAQQVARFGNVLHISGTDAAALKALVDSRRGKSGEQWSEVHGGLEEAFIYLMGQSQRQFRGGGAMNFSFARFVAVLAKEFIQMRRDRVTFAMMVGVPIMQLLLFGFAINADPHHLPALIEMDDASPLARSVLSGMKESDYFDFRGIVTSPAEGDKALRDGTANFVVVIPNGFERDALRGLSPQVLLSADASDPSASGAAVAAMSGIVAQAEADTLVGALRPAISAAPPVTVTIHKQFNPEGRTALNIVPGLLAIIMAMTMVLITAVAIVRETERGTMETLIATPVRPLEVLLGKITPYVLVGYVQTLVFLLAGRYVFNVPFLGEKFAFFLGFNLYIVTNLALGFLISTLSRNQMQAMQLSFFTLLPQILLSGFMFPFAGMPKWAQALGTALPATHFLRLTRKIMLKGAGLADVTGNIMGIVVIMLVIVALALARYRQTLD